MARAVKEAGAAAVTATNRYTGFMVDIETGEPRLGGPAGIGGVWAKPLSLRWVHRIYTELGMPITGSNGIYDHRDVVEFIMTGAGIGAGRLGPDDQGHQVSAQDHRRPGRLHGQPRLSRH